MRFFGRDLRALDLFWIILSEFLPFVLQLIFPFSWKLDRSQLDVYEHEHEHRKRNFDEAW